MIKACCALGPNLIMASALDS